MCFASASALVGSQPDFDSSPSHFLASRLNTEGVKKVHTRGIDLYEDSEFLRFGVLGNKVCTALFKGVCLFGNIDRFDGPEVGYVFS